MSDQEKNKDLGYIPVDFDPFGNQEKIAVSTTEPQREIFTNVKFGGKSANCAYNESVSLMLEGEFDVDVFRSSVDLLINRHQALRSTFSEDGQSLLIHELMLVDVPLVDVTHLNGEKLNHRITDLLELDSQTEFDLVQGPLARIFVIKKSSRSFQLVLTFHHIICDGWSLGLIMQDISKCYSALSRNEIPDFEDQVKFTQWVDEELNFNNTDESVKTQKFWLDLFKDNLPEMELPVDKSRPAIRTFNARRIDIPIPNEVVVKLKHLGAQSGASFVTTMVAAFEAFLYRITGTEDIALGLPAAGQNLPGFERLVGHCVNLLPLRTNVKGDQLFSDYLKRRKVELLDVYENQRFTFGKLVRQLNVKRDPSRIPLVPVAFNIDIGITDGVEFNKCEYSFKTNPRQYENFELFLNVSGVGTELEIECTYNTDLFDDTFIRYRMDEFNEFLNGLATNSHSNISQIPLLNSNEKYLLEKEWNGVDLEYDRETNISELFQKQKEILPDRIAVKWNGNEYTYSELGNRCDIISNSLIDNGVRPGDLVAVCMDRSIDLIASMLAVLRCGGAYVPIDPDYPVDRIEYIIRDTKCKLVITDPDSLKYFDGSGVSILDATKNDWRLSPHNLHEFPVFHSNSLSYIIYTSGSTGEPKGVELTHSNALALFAWAATVYDEEQISGVLASTSVCFDLSIFEIFNTLVHGGTLILVRNILELPELKDELRPTLLNTVPSALSELINSGFSIPRSVNTINLAGEPLEQSLVDKLYQLDHIESVYDLYGPSEDTTYSTFKLRSPGGAYSIGKVLPNSRLYLLDDQLQMVPPGLIGEIYLTGDKVARGYYNRPELTESRFIQRISGLHSNSRFYRTGDLAKHNSEGDVVYLGRSDDQVKVRGYRIELGEIEFKIKSISGIIDCVCDVKTNDNIKSLVAFVIVENEVEFDVIKMKDQLKKVIPLFMIPDKIIVVEKIPLSPNGKVNKSALLSLDVNAISRSLHEYEEPTNALEETLALIFREVLGLDKVGRNDNFFDLGGHSLLGVRLFNLLEERTGIKASLPLLFSAPIVSELASVLSGKSSEKPWTTLVPLKKSGTKTPLFCIHMHNGNIHRWSVITKHMEADQPVIAIQPRGLDPSQQPHHSIEDMAQFYVDEIKKYQPNGPYKLAGLCFSGMVVYEMAVILQKFGDKVDFLAMVNNYAPPENPTVYKVKSELNKFMKLEMGEKFNYALEKNINFSKRLFVKSLDHNKVKDEDLENPDYSDNDLRTIHSLALLNYHPKKKYEGDLLIIRTDEPIEAFYNDSLGWDRLIKGKIKIYVIEGCDNDTIITDEPYNIELSLIIRRSLVDNSTSDEIKSKNNTKNNPHGGQANAAIL